LVTHDAQYYRYTKGMKKYLGIGSAIIAALMIGGLLFIFGPKNSFSDIANTLGLGGLSAQGLVKYNVLARGPHALSLTERTNYRIKNATDFAQLWVMIYGDSDANPVPTVDFSREEVLGLFDGSHASSGYYLTVNSVVDVTPNRVVSIDHVTVPATCNAANTPSSPFVLLVVPITTYALAHNDTEDTGPCQPPSTN
jgi:hypothetical protein